MDRIFRIVLLNCLISVCTFAENNDSLGPAVDPAADSSPPGTGRADDWKISRDARAEPGKNPRDIVSESNERRKLAGVEMISILNLYNASGNKRERKISSVTKLFDGGKTERRMVKFNAPADVRGTGFLTYDYEIASDDMWLYLPALRKTRRIVASDKAKSFMGSEFTYSDTSPPPIDDFVYTLIGQDKLEGTACHVIEAKAKTSTIAEENGYSRRVSAIAAADYTIRKVEYFDLGNKLLKVLRTDKITLVDPERKTYVARYMEMVNHQNKRRSELIIEKIELRKDIPEDYFTIRYLER